VLTFNFYERLILKLQAQELMTCLQMLNHTIIIMYSVETLNYMTVRN